jgi:hypothetical protein
MLVSKCCNSHVTMHMSPDFPGDIVEEMTIGTCYYICTKCGKPCDVQSDELDIEHLVMGEVRR